MKFCWDDEKKEIAYHIINSALAGGLVFLGSLSAGRITWESIGLAAVASLIVCITKFKSYWETQKGAYSSKKKKLTKKAQLFSFIA